MFVPISRKFTKFNSRNCNFELNKTKGNVSYNISPEDNVDFNFYLSTSFWSRMKKTHGGIFLFTYEI